MKPGSGFILDNRTNYSVEDLTPRQDIQESLGTRRIKDGTVHRIENLAEPEGTGTTTYACEPLLKRPCPHILSTVITDQLCWMLDSQPVLYITPYSLHHWIIFTVPVTGSYGSYPCPGRVIRCSFWTLLPRVIRCSSCSTFVANCSYSVWGRATYLGSTPIT